MTATKMFLEEDSSVAVMAGMLWALDPLCLKLTRLFVVRIIAEV